METDMKRTWKLLLGALLLSALVSCVDTAPIEGRLNALSEKIAAQESAIARANDNAIAIGKFLRGEDILIVSWKALDHGYEMELSDGTTVRVCYGSETPALVPLIGVDADGYWILSLSGGKTYERIAGAAPLSDNDGHTPQVRINADGCWEISTDGKQWQVLLDGAGRPVSAVDGAAVAGVSSFFTSVKAQTRYITSQPRDSAPESSPSAIRLSPCPSSAMQSGLHSRAIFLTGSLPETTIPIHPTAAKPSQTTKPTPSGTRMLFATRSIIFTDAAASPVASMPALKTTGNIQMPIWINAKYKMPLQFASLNTRYSRLPPS